MDLLSDVMFKKHLDPPSGVPAQSRGYCYGWEIYEYLKNRPDFLFKTGVPGSQWFISEDELKVFMRFVGQVAGIDVEEKGNIMQAKIKYSFLLAQLEQNFYIRITSP